MDKMTLFYSKNTGDIKAYTAGTTDMGYFGEDEIDMQLIYNFIIVDLDNYIMDNINQFKVEGNQVLLKREVDLSKYKQEGDE